jgi:4'-phosphopantetheinyl transferase
MAGIGEHWKLQPVGECKLERNAVHVWRSRFQPILPSDRDLTENLSEEEMVKARGFLRHSDRDRYVFSHLLLRKILAAYITCEPQKLNFNTNKYGKPFLEVTGGDAEPSFSLSHSLDMTLIAVAGGTGVGVDVEYMKTVRDAREIVNRFFSAHERSFLNSLPPADFNEAFFAYWTAKEAFLKGIGKGMSYPMDKFSVRFLNTGPLGWISIDGEQPATCCWNVVRISPGPNYSGALAIEAPGIQPEFFEYSWH